MQYYKQDFKVFTSQLGVFKAYELTVKAYKYTDVYVYNVAQFL